MFNQCLRNRTQTNTFCVFKVYAKEQTERNGRPHIHHNTEFKCYEVQLTSTSCTVKYPFSPQDSAAVSASVGASAGASAKTPWLDWAPLHRLQVTQQAPFTSFPSSWKEDVLFLLYNFILLSIYLFCYFELGTGQNYSPFQLTYILRLVQIEFFIFCRDFIIQLPLDRSP